MVGALARLLVGLLEVLDRWAAALLDLTAPWRWV